MRPEDKLLPIFSNAFFAEAAARRLSASKQIELQPASIECLGCFLNEYSGELGRETVRGALLDDQWSVRYFTCAESPGARNARHFLVEDGTRGEYALGGCASAGVKPIWFERRWDSSK